MASRIFPRPRPCLAMLALTSRTDDGPRWLRAQNRGQIRHPGGNGQTSERPVWKTVSRRKRRPASASGSLLGMPGPTMGFHADVSHAQPSVECDLEAIRGGLFPHSALSSTTPLTGGPFEPTRTGGGWAGGGNRHMSLELDQRSGEQAGSTTWIQRRTRACPMTA